MTDQAFDLERLLSAALRPVDPPARLTDQIETRLSAVTRAAADELSEWADELEESELASLRDPRNWVRPVAAITAGGQTLDFYLSPKRNVAAAKRFLAKALRSNASAGYPRVINTDKAPSLARAIAELKSEEICPRQWNTGQ